MFCADPARSGNPNRKMITPLERRVNVPFRFATFWFRIVFVRSRDARSKEASLAAVEHMQHQGSQGVSTLGEDVMSGIMENQSAVDSFPVRSKGPSRSGRSIVVPSRCL